MKLATLEGNKFDDLRAYQYQLSGGLAGELGKFSPKRAFTSTVSHVVAVVPQALQSKVQDAVAMAKAKAEEGIAVAKAKAEEQIKIQADKVKAFALLRVEQEKAKLKNKIKANTNFDGMVRSQLDLYDKATNEFLNTIPIIGNVNRGLTLVLGDTPSHFIIEKAGMKIYGVGKELLIKQGYKILSKYIPAINDADAPTLQTGFFDMYMSENPNFITFGMNKPQLSIMPPDEMINVVNNYLSANSLEYVILCPKDTPPDVAKIYYFTAGQPDYNPYNKLLYEQITGTQKVIDDVKIDPEKVISVIVSSSIDADTLNL